MPGVVSGSFEELLESELAAFQHTSEAEIKEMIGILDGFVCSLQAFAPTANHMPVAFMGCETDQDKSKVPAEGRF